MGAERLSGRAGPQEEERQDQRKAVLSIGPHSPKLGYLHARHPGADFQPRNNGPPQGTICTLSAGSEAASRRGQVTQAKHFP